jgi:hypothetical protein
MHERRLESSFYKTMTRLKTLQTVRRIEWEAAEERSAAEVPEPQNRKSDFAKQSQLASFRRKSDARTSKNRNRRNLSVFFRKTKPICARPGRRNFFCRSGL